LVLRLCNGSVSAAPGEGGGRGPRLAGGVDPLNEEGRLVGEVDPWRTMGMKNWMSKLRSCPVLLATLGLLVLVPALGCSDDATCVDCEADDVDPAKVIDPRSLGDGTGYPGESWTMAPTPEALGWSERRLRDASDMAGKIGSDAFMVVDRGISVWEYGQVGKNYVVQSCRKSFLSALYGIFVHNGTIDLGLTLEELGIDDLPPSLTAEEKQATLENLVMARSGVYHEAAAESQSMKDARPPRGSHPPGTFWYYNNWDFNVLGTVFIQLTHEDIFEALYERFAVPLQMQEFTPANGWYYYEEMSEHPAYHFNMSARDMARFGLLFLREGRWREGEIVPSAWVERSTEPYSDAGTGWDYGYMWWVGKPKYWEGHDVIAAQGGSGQAVFVVRDMDIVITHKVDYDTWRGDWNDVYELVKRILYAKVM
jgi:CubicO group peptidase (beta-lactamase class C family)